MSIRTTRLLLGSLTALAVAGCPGVGLAQGVQPQSQPQPQTQPEAGQASIDSTNASDGEIIVTAQRRSESLQKVPIAISVVSGQALAQSQFTRVEDLQYLVPSLKFQGTGNGNPSYSIRGISTFTFDDAVEQSVGVVIDDVVQLLPRTNFLNTLADIDRVEVLRGPQGTLFGKNTTAGLIAITTKRPQLGVLSSEGQVQYGSHNEVRAYDTVNLPVSDTLAFRVLAGYQYRDGLLENVYLNRRSKPTRDWNVRAKVLWEPNSNLSIYAIADYQRSNSGLADITLRTLNDPNSQQGSILLGFGIVPSPQNYQVAGEFLSYKNVSTYGGQATIEYKFDGGASLISTTSYRGSENHENAENDLTPRRFLVFNANDTNSRQFTQEVRLSSPADDRFEYILGAFYSSFKPVQTQLQNGTLNLIPDDSTTLLGLSPGYQNRVVKSRSYAFFGQGVYHLTPKLRVNVGGRFTHDSIQASLAYTPAPGTCQIAYAFGAPCLPDPYPAPIGASRKHGDWSGRAVIQYDVAPAAMVYASAARGYKGPAITTISGLLRSVNPETVLSYEAGVKAALFDRRFTVNLAVYSSKFKDFQAQAYNATVPPAGGFEYTNAGGIKSRGVEVDFTAVPAEGLNLSGGLAYSDAKFTSYFPACPTIYQGTAICAANGTINAAGQTLSNAPKWTVNLAASFRRPITDRVSAFVNANYAYRSAALFQVADPGTRQDAYGIVNATAGVDLEEKLRVSVFARNLFDKHFVGTILSNFFVPGTYVQSQTIAAQRTVGVSLDWKFGG